MVFNSSNPNSGNYDLGSPNKKCPGGGPGKGQGGRPGEVGENCEPLGNLLIISEDCNQDEPNYSVYGGTFTFYFGNPMGLKLVGLLDFEGGALIEMFVSKKSPVSFELRRRLVGNNSFWQQDINIWEALEELRITLYDSGAIAYLDVVPA